MISICSARSAFLALSTLARRNFLEGFLTSVGGGGGVSFRTRRPRLNWSGLHFLGSWVVTHLPGHHFPPVAEQQ